MITYTDAPVAYDGFGTHTLEIVGDGRRGEVRRVCTPEQHVEWQRARYSSGMNLCASQAEWAELRDLILV